MTGSAKIVRVITLMLALSLISTVMISGTFAKYVSEYSGQDTALVARWSFDGTVGELEEEEETQVLRLFNHDYNLHVNQMGDDAYIIAPGINGEFLITMDYLADVAADVVINIVETTPTVDYGNPVLEKPLPIEYSIDDGDWLTAAGLSEGLIDYLATEYELEVVDQALRIPASNVDADSALPLEATVKWRWAYDSNEQGEDYAWESNDEIDTLFGQLFLENEDARLAYTLDITVTATQVAPETS